MIRRENWLLTEKYLKEGVREVNPKIQQTSIDRYEWALRHILVWADDNSFEEAFSSTKVNFNEYVANLPARRGDGVLSLEAQKKIILVTKTFLTWARGKKSSGAKNLSEKSIANLIPPKVITTIDDGESVSLEEILELAKLDCGDDIVMERDIAGTCFAYLSGARPKAIETAPIKAIDLENRSFLQDPRIGVATKNGKAAETYLLPIPELLLVVKRWDDYVRNNLPEDAVWYAPVDSHWGEYTLQERTAGEYAGVDMKKRIRKIYERAGMRDSYKSPRLFRHGHAVYGLKRCKNMAEYQAVSRNLMHSSIKITDQIYAVVEKSNRKDIIMSFGFNTKPVVEGDLMEMLQGLDKKSKKDAFHYLADELID